MMAVKNPECPICGDTFKDGRGLSGHLQFKHSLSGDEHSEMLDEGMERGEKQETPARDEVGGKTGRSIRDRELELKGMLLECQDKQREVREKIEEVKEEDRSVSFLNVPLATDTEAQKRLEKLQDRLQGLEDREQSIIDELDKLQS